MATKKKRQTFEKLRREQAVREKRVRKQERREAAREAKALNVTLESSPSPEAAGAETQSPDGGAARASGGDAPGEPRP